MDLCRQFHCLPSQLAKEDAELIRLITIEQLGRHDPQGGDWGG